MNWRDTLPHGHFELWIIRIFIVVAIFWAGVGTGIIYSEVIRGDRFTAGAQWMQKAYTSGGIVTRVVEGKPEIDVRPTVGNKVFRKVVSGLDFRWRKEKADE